MAASISCCRAMRCSHHWACRGGGRLRPEIGGTGREGVEGVAAFEVGVEVAQKALCLLRSAGRRFVADFEGGGRALLRGRGVGAPAIDREVGPDVPLRARCVGPFFFELRPKPGKECLCRGIPGVFGVAGDLPLLPARVHRLVELPAQGLQRLLVLLPDHVDAGVVGDGLQGDVRDALVDEAVADVAVGGRFGRGLAGELGFLALPFRAVREEVVGIAGAHDPGAGQREGDAGGVDGDPAPAPLLGDVGGGAGPAGGVEDEVAGIGGH